jgi:predicted DNA binding CopG/RHH family protein
MAKYVVEDLTDLELPEDEAQTFERQIAQADRDVEEARVNFRWGSKQVAVIKKAADLAGVPYQTYMKTVLFRQALADLAEAKALGVS